MFLAESISLIHTVASVGRLELEQTSLLKFIFQITNEFAFGNFLEINFLRFLLLQDTTVLLITLHKAPPAYTPLLLLVVIAIVLR